MMVSVTQAASRLGLSRSTVYGLAARRVIAHYRMGGKIVFAEADLSAYLESCRVSVEDKQFRPPPPQRPKLRHVQL
jgi:excisionase family DNA binding protein